MTGLLAVGLGACSGGGTSGVAPGAQAIRVGVDALPAAKGNPFNSVGSPGIYTLAAIYDPLTFVDQDGSVKPWLATAWKNTSPTTWNFTLREGVKFSNGEALDAQGVADVVNFVKTNAEVSKQAVAGDLRNIVVAKALDPSTVEVSTSVPDPILPNELTELYIPAPKALISQGIQAITNEPVGTGPFKVTNWGANKVALAAFTGSWRPPKVGTLEIQGLPDPAARLQALQSGQIDMITGVSPDQVSQLTGQTKVDVTKGNQVMSLAFINTKGQTALNDQRVRQALNYAVDKEAMARDLLLGKGEATGQGATPRAVGYNPDVAPYAHDTTKAKQLLTEAGFPNGFKMTADVVVGSFPADATIYQLMKRDLAAVGVDVDLRQVTFSAWLQNYLSNKWEAQAFGLSWNALPTMDGSRAMSNFSCLKKPAFFCDQPTADLLSQALTNLDNNTRTKQLEKVGSAMHDNPPALYLPRQIDIIGLAAAVQGFQNNNRFFPYDKMVKQ
ncbi:MAG: ABC transporter substrate-binding protein [Mycobacteriaceae bacterium]